MTNCAGVSFYVLYCLSVCLLLRGARCSMHSVARLQYSLYCEAREGVWQPIVRCRDAQRCLLICPHRLRGAHAHYHYAFSMPEVYGCDISTNPWHRVPLSDAGFVAPVLLCCCSMLFVANVLHLSVYSCIQNASAKAGCWCAGLPCGGELHTRLQSIGADVKLYSGQ